MAGFGWDAQIVQSINPSIKKILGKIIFGIKGLQKFIFMNNNKIKVSVDNEEIYADWILCLNTKFYAGHYPIANTNIFENKIVSYIFKDLKKFSTDGIHPGDPSGKSYHHQTQYTFAKGGVIAIECVDWSEEMKDQHNWWDNFSITIYSKEYEKFIREEGY